jgi:hypothetical protein
MAVQITGRQRCCRRPTGGACLQLAMYPRRVLTRPGGPTGRLTCRDGTHFVNDDYHQECAVPGHPHRWTVLGNQRRLAFRPGQQVAPPNWKRSLHRRHQSRNTCREPQLTVDDLPGNVHVGWLRRSRRGVVRPPSSRPVAIRVGGRTRCRAEAPIENCQHRVIQRLLPEAGSTGLSSRGYARVSTLRATPRCVVFDRMEFGRQP